MNFKGFILSVFFVFGVLTSVIKFDCHIISAHLSAEDSTVEIINSHGFAVFGSLKYAADFEHFDYVNPDAPQGGELRIFGGSSFDSFNRIAGRGKSARGLGYVYMPLLSGPYSLYYSGSIDEPSSAYCLLAERLEYPSDISEVTFHLRKEAVFSDGSPVTAHDIAYGAERQMELHPTFQEAVAAIKEIIVIDDRTIKFVFKQKNVRENILIAGQFEAMKKSELESVDLEKAFVKPAIGCGPYVVEKLDIGRRITYKKIDHFWGKDLPFFKGQYNFDRITYIYIKDDAKRFEAFKAGEMDLHLESSSTRWATGYDFESVKNGKIKPHKIHHDKVQGMAGLVMNLRRDVFKDPKVRRAIALLYDFEWTNKNLFYDAYKRSNSYFENSDLSAKGLPSDDELEILNQYRDQLPEEVFTTPYSLPVNDGSGNIRRVLGQAQRLLLEAGYVINESGKMIHKETGKPLSFECLLPSNGIKRYVDKMAKNAQNIGIDMRIAVPDISNFYARREAHDYDMVFGSFYVDNIYAGTLKNRWSSEIADTPGSYNFTGLKDAVVDAILHDISLVNDAQKLKTYTRVLDRILLWHHLLVPLHFADYDRVAYWDILAKPKLDGIKLYQDYSFYESIILPTWWVDQEKYEALKK